LSDELGFAAGSAQLVAVSDILRISAAASSACYLLSSANRYCRAAKRRLASDFMWPPAAASVLAEHAWPAVEEAKLGDLADRRRAQLD